VNLLGGCARTRRLRPFIFRELNGDFQLLKVLDTGLIPSIYFSNSPFEDLEAYAGNYLREEIADDLPAWRKSVKRKPVSTSKFFFFDIGVARFLQGRRGLEMKSPKFGEAFEALYPS
jgi:hypothetical protein